MPVCMPKWIVKCETWKRFFFCLSRSTGGSGSGGSDDLVMVWRLLVLSTGAYLFFFCFAFSLVHMMKNYFVHTHNTENIETCKCNILTYTLHNIQYIFIYFTFADGLSDKRVVIYGTVWMCISQQQAFYICAAFLLIGKFITIVCAVHSAHVYRLFVGTAHVFRRGLFMGNMCVSVCTTVEHVCGFLSPD